MCGEKRAKSICRKPKAGSPPHVRGKGKDIDRTGRAAGITPACAGKSCISVRLSGLRGDHPRMCGEKESNIGGYVSTVGSPPHVRGKVRRLTLERLFTGITPACAGKSTKLRNAIRSKWDHPRMCGEKSAASTCPICARGSPPHVRGKVKENQTLWYEDRITPACAGKSYIRLALLHPTWDHPRMCGEKQLVAELPKTSLGSPPHVRGKASVQASSL